jgi:mannitol/fructose-specific phosphotransferase system IIA component (Ntr-type)
MKSPIINFDNNTTTKICLSGLIQKEGIHLNLKGNSKETLIIELLDILETHGRILDRNIALKDLLSREQTMSTGIPNGIAIPHAKTNAVQELTAAIGIKKSGVDFDSALDDKTRIIILALAPPDKSKSLYEFLLAMTATLNDDTLRSKIIAAKTPDEIVELLRQHK